MTECAAAAAYILSFWYIDKEDDELPIDSIVWSTIPRVGETVFIEPKDSEEFGNDVRWVVSEVLYDFTHQQRERKRNPYNYNDYVRVNIYLERPPEKHVSV